MDIVGKRKLYFTISIVAIIIGFAFLIYNVASGNGAFNYDVEFTGGTEMVVDIGKDFNNDDIRQAIVDNVGEQSPQIQKIIGTTSVAIKMKSLDSESRTKVMEAIQQKYEIGADVFEVNDISASISQEMQTTAILAVISACIGILLYVTLRFRDIRTGGSAIIALVHDSILVILAYSVFRIPLNYSFIAVILTILGYSINATIVIFDRIRENRKMMQRVPLEQLINTSITQTLKRCIFTSCTVLIVSACLYILGVPSIRDFALPIMVGVVWGTFSSVFISGSLLYVLTVGAKKAFAKNA